MSSFHYKQKLQREKDKARAAALRRRQALSLPALPKTAFGPVIQLPGPHPTLEQLVQQYVEPQKSEVITVESLSDRQLRNLLRKLSRPPPALIGPIVDPPPPSSPAEVEAGIRPLIQQWGHPAPAAVPASIEQQRLLDQLF